jgi:hypothetical protein
MSEYEPGFMRQYRKYTRAEVLESFANSTKERLVAERAEKSPNLSCFITEFPLAMAAIAEVHDYARGPLVKGDYMPSLLRHLFGIGEHPDHKAAVAWNAIADLEIMLRKGRGE